MTGNVRAGVKRISHAGHGVEPGDEIARLSTDAGESAGRQDLAVCLYCNCIDGVVRVRIETGVERAVALRRAMRLRVTDAPPLGASAVKLPPIRILPSGWTTTASTVPFAFGSKPSSADCARAAVTKQTIRANEVRS